MEKLQLLESVLGKGVKSNRDYYQFECPFHKGTHGPKLGVSLGTGGWKCWVCPNKGKSVSGLLYKLNSPTDKIREAKSLWKEKVHFQKEENSKLELPKEFIPLWQTSGSFFFNKAKNYILSRGVTERDIVKHRIGYCESGRYSDMIIMPSYNESGQLVFFVGRTFNQVSNYRFSIPPNIDKNLVLDENLVNWQEPIILVESKLDAIIVRRNAVPLNGKQIPEKLKKKIIEEQVPKIIFCLDGDAMKDNMIQANYFIQNGIECFRTTLPQSEDPSSLGYEKVWEFIERAEKISESDNFEFKILEKLG